MATLKSQRYELRLRHTFRLARGASDSRENLLIEIEDDGLVGRGEAAPIARYGQDWRSAAAAVERMFERLDDLRAFDNVRALTVAGQPAAAAALDMALRDLAGQRCGLPVWRMLGLDRRQMPVTSMTIGLDEPEIVQQKVEEAAGFAVLKVKMGTDDDRQVIEAVREVTDRPLWVDANEGWTLDGAAERLAWLADQGVELVEQPLPEGELEAMRELRRRSPLPIFADESVHNAADIPRLAEAFDGINIKLMKCGGLGEALRMIAVARAHGMKIMIGCMVESSLAITAAAQLAPLIDHADLDGNLLVANDPFQDAGGVRVVDGALVLSDAPGLGLR